MTCGVMAWCVKVIAKTQSATPAPITEFHLSVGTGSTSPAHYVPVCLIRPCTREHVDAGGCIMETLGKLD